MNTWLKLGARSSARTDELRDEAANKSGRASAIWWINGYRVRLFIWTQSEFAKLETHPSDAQYHPRGLWCALRVVDAEMETPARSAQGGTSSPG
jgi:hypothetical protein